MSISPDAEPFIAAIWERVLGHAAVDPERFHLLPVAGAAVRGCNQAACYPPGNELYDEPEDLLRGAILNEANLSEHRHKHRIAIYEDIDEDDPLAVAVMAAKLRHEVRHGEQREVCGNRLFALDELADMLVGWKVGGLPGGAALYHLKPVESDANAASARYLRTCHGDVVDELLDGPDGVLARSNTLPGELEDLPSKTVAFMFTMREIAEDPVHGQPTFEQRLAAIHLHYAAQWLALCRRAA